MAELRPGLWWWAGRDPAWAEDQDCGPDVTSSAYRNGERTVLFDTDDPPEELRGAEVLRFRELPHLRVELLLVTHVEPVREGARDALAGVLA
jgi:hypothetical protein